jgi:hypothetical protein
VGSSAGAGTSSACGGAVSSGTVSAMTPRNCCEEAIEVVM